MESVNGEPCLTRLFGMSRRTVFNWLRLVEYDAPALHHALAARKLGLQQALVFREHPAQIIEAWIQRCIEGEWSSRELKLRLSAAEPPEPPDPPAPERATLHGRMTSEPTPSSAALHGDDAVTQHLTKAGQWLLRVSPEQIDHLSEEEIHKLKTGLRMVLEVIASL